MDWNSRPYFNLAKLRAQALGDIKKFIPEGYFTKKTPKISLNDFARFSGITAKEKAHTVNNETNDSTTWGKKAAEIGKELLCNYQTDILTPRQLAASELLMYLGYHAMAISSGSRSLVHFMSKNLRRAIKDYLDHLEEQEKIPFLYLLDEEQKQSNPHTKLKPTTSPVTESWRTNARKIAEEILKEKPFLKVEKLAEKTYTEMTKRKMNGEVGMTGRSGDVPSSDTIRRHALVGIKNGR